MSDDIVNIVVLTVFGMCVAAVIAGYILAWRSRRASSRKVGSLLVAGVAAFAGLCMSVWIIGAVMPFPPPEGESVWGVLGFLLIFSPVPLSAFYFFAKFVRRAFRNEVSSQSDTVNNTAGRERYFLAALVLMGAFAVSWLAWGEVRDGAGIGMGRLELWLGYAAMVVVIPGWFVVSSFDNSQAQLATRLTDILIPLASGLIWGLTVLMLLDITKSLWKYIKKIDKSMWASLS